MSFQEKQSPTAFGAVCIEPEASLQEALQTMRTLHIHHLVVQQGKKVVGVLSDRDILSRAFHQDTLALDQSKRVKDVMTDGVPGVDVDAELTTAIDVMLDRGVTAVPLLKGDEVAGLVTDSDLVRILKNLAEEDEGSELTNRLKIEMSNPLVASVMKTLADIGL